MALAVIALVLRIAVPTGWMPVVANDGSVILVLCPAAAAASAEAPDGHGAHQGHPQPSDKNKMQHGGGGGCAFAPLQASVDVWQAPPPLLALSITGPLASPDHRTAYFPRGPPALPPPARGPPLGA